MMVEASFLFGDATYTIKLNIGVTVSTKTTWTRSFVEWRSCLARTRVV